MATEKPLIRFYDLSGPIPWSPKCWNTRFVLNFKNVPYETIQVPFPGVKPTCEKLFGDLEATGVDDSVPIIELLETPNRPYKVLNDSTPIAELLEKTFPPEEGYKPIVGLDQIRQYEKERGRLLGWILRFIAPYIYENCVDPTDGSREFFKRTREGFFKCSLDEVMDVAGGGEENVLKELATCWEALRVRMQSDDGTGERMYIFRIYKLFDCFSPTSET